MHPRDPRDPRGKNIKVLSTNEVRNLLTSLCSAIIQKKNQKKKKKEKNNKYKNRQLHQTQIQGLPPMQRQQRVPVQEEEEGQTGSQGV